MRFVTVIDDDHIYVDGKQYVSLRRFFENRSEIAIEAESLIEKIDKLTEENNHLKALLKERI